MKFRLLASQDESTDLLSHNPHFDDSLIKWNEKEAL